MSSIAKTTTSLLPIEALYPRKDYQEKTPRAKKYVLHYLIALNPKFPVFLQLGLS